MRKFNHSGPSPAIAVAVIALVFAVAGSAIAGTDGLSEKLTKSKVKSIAKKQADKQLKANVAGSHVNTADTATNAENATNLGGTAASAYETASAYAERTANLALTGAFQEVAGTTITTATQSRVLATSSIEVQGNGGGDDDAGCRIEIAGAQGPENNFTIPDTMFDQDTTSVAFAQVVAAGTHAVSVECDETGDVVVDDAELIITAIAE